MYMYVLYVSVFWWFPSIPSECHLPLQSMHMSSWLLSSGTGSPWGDSLGCADLICCP